jgi:hypothetical protein
MFERRAAVESVDPWVGKTEGVELASPDNPVLLL